MNFLELTSCIGEPEQYSDFPEFQSDVWPLLRRRGKEIEGVYLFRGDNSSSFGWSGYYEVVTPHIVRIRPLDELRDGELGKLEQWSFYAGHLNVLYRVATGSSLGLDLCNMYPTVHLSSDDVDQLALEPEALAALGAFTAGLPQDALHFSFAHDGDPVFIFGHLEALRALLRAHYASIPTPQP